jgi:hypothetical protein
MPSPSEFALTSSLSQPSRLGDGLALGNTGVWFIRNGPPAEITQESKEVRAHEVAIEEQKRIKHVCDEDRRRFKWLYDDERERERIKQQERQRERIEQLHSRERRPEGGVESTNVTPEEQRAKDEEQKRAKRICDEDQRWFRRLYDEERERGEG